MSKKTNKKPSKKITENSVWKGDGWNVVVGRLKPGPGRPSKTSHLFEVVAEKLPFECLKLVRGEFKERGVEANGVYLAHDSMGVARYGGRGDIFGRLVSHKKNHPRELLYFSFFVISNKSHEREIETAILRAAGGQLTLNEKKVRMGLQAGTVADYEPGTWYFERQGAKGPKRK